MRQVGHIPDPVKAGVFEDYLFTLGVFTKLDRQGAGWNIWVLDEDRLLISRKELADYLVNPIDEKYASAVSIAEGIRKQSQLEAGPEEEFDEDSEETSYPFPKVTIFLILLTLLASLTLLFSETKKDLIIQYLSFARETDPPLKSSLISQGEVWRLITPVFIHFGWLHLLFNLALLFELGSLIEFSRGQVRFIILFLILALASNLAQFALGGITWDGWRLTMLTPPLFGGMSGVIYGFLGYAWMKGQFQEDLNIAVPKPFLHFLLFWLVLCWTGLLGPVANYSHTFGLIAGTILGLFPKKTTL
ncbi:MAG: rhomboid family intramembrane serine protease [Gemmataceae bacterium]|nr:rhomboid family intramembrane serine protease [Gemmataceae bacterium]